MEQSRQYTTRRLGIIEALVDAFKDIDGTGYYLTNLDQNVSPRLKFWDEVEEFPALHLNAGSVKEEDSVAALDALLEDVETVIEENSRIRYKDRNNVDQYTQQITVVSIDTDEGVLEPLGVGEIIVEVRY